MKRIAVFCGSSLGTKDVYEQQAYYLGKQLANNNLELVYGGASVGLMGAVANGVLEHHGKVIGVLPTFLRKVEIGHHNLTQLIIVDTMHQRKTKMDELSDGIIALPGGFGTLEELFEMLTWLQLGLHKKPVALLNVDGFYDELLVFIQKMIDNGFLKQMYLDMIVVSSDVDDLLEKMNNYIPPAIDKWINKDEV